MPPYRRARPTVRVLEDDLSTDWTEPHALRAVTESRWQDLHPFTELPHPLLRKAAELYGADPANDPAPRLITCSGDLRLQELRNSQWRAGLWTDPETGVRWICAAGLAKGGHKDEADFYQWLGSLVGRTGGSELLPTELDLTLFKTEKAAWLITQWELRIQQEAAAALGTATESGVYRWNLPHPTRSTAMASAAVTVAYVDDCEELVVDLRIDNEFAASNLGWLLTARVLVSLSPPVQSWDRFGATFSTIAEHGYSLAQLDRLRSASAHDELLPQEPGTVGHRVHVEHLAAAMIEGTASRALCGVFFVPTQDHAELQECEECRARYTSLRR
ncbi:DUF3039 domain-containing protein [Nocardia sp. AG03]|uniref:DUF3039 domain-containing protein n=1 Tax=Nocardia sp. AG03 TaxID=3025312 RepID=UPI0024187137|nr:DUF3039 domain-containing protein [Nocardia sp. AG03]